MTEQQKKFQTLKSAADALKPLGKGSSSRDVLDALIHMIEAANLCIGDHLPPEVEIAQRLGISRAKVREALVAWQNMGIVTRNKKAGTRLAAEVTANAIHLPLSIKIEAESLLRTHAVRRPLEIEAVRYATRHITDDQASVSLSRMEDLMRVFEAGEDWRPADHRFHATLYEASRNPLFGQMIQQIQQAFYEIYQAPFGRPQLGQSSIPLHSDLAHAVVSRKENKAAAIMEEILNLVETEIHQIMEMSDD
ncbi:MAG: FCD domain-containing protein [Cohaesibacter sp.]|nr:FCD domain-containing protein [Cohaesibacter sp.]